MKHIVTGTVVAAAIFIAAYTVNSMENKMEKQEITNRETREAVFAGGCFWCTESDFEKVDGVIEAISGYTGGHAVNPTYEQVTGGGTGHFEAVKVLYDPARISYPELLEIFWRHVNPTDTGGQFVDRGPQYRSAIFYADNEQRRLAEESKKELAATGVFDASIGTEILPLGAFYPAEEYHQDYYKKNPLRYKWYRSNSGRDRFLKKKWGAMDRKIKTGQSQGIEESAQKTSHYTAPDKAEVRRRLTPAAVPGDPGKRHRTAL